MAKMNPLSEMLARAGKKPPCKPCEKKRREARARVLGNLGKNRGLGKRRGR